MARFAPLYKVEVQDAAVDVRASFSPADKFGLDAPVGAFDEVAVTLEVRSPAPAERVRQLVAHAERGCHSSQSLQARVPVRLVVRLNDDDLEPDKEEP
jgi:organic hydroperoxide reductase OsmC/OhrA